MGKFLLLLLVFLAAWWLAKGFRRKDAAGEGAPDAPERMVNCAHCGLYLPQSEALEEGDRFYCCAEHRRLAG